MIKEARTKFDDLSKEFKDQMSIEGQVLSEQESDIKKAQTESDLIHERLNDATDRELDLNRQH
jgi:hypothetical protein